MSRSESDAKLVEAYLRHYAEKDDSLLWAMEQLHEMLEERSRPRVELDSAANRCGPNSRGALWVGPLDDIPYGRGRPIDEVERLTREDPKFRRSLKSVYNESESPGDYHDCMAKAAAGTSD